MTEQEPKRKSAWSAYSEEIRFAMHLLVRNKLVLTGLVMTTFFILIALLAGTIVPSAATTITFSQKYCWNNHIFNWGVISSPCPSNITFPLGTDGFGRDLLQMIILAIPLDISIALEIVAAALVIGILLGAVAGYSGGWVDELVLRITDIFFAFPFLILALVFASILGRTVQNLELAVLLVWWPLYVRLLRGQILSEKQKQYVEALRAVGVGRFRTLFFHIIPNSIYPVLVQATLDIGAVILTFSALFFLGFAPNPALPELGNLTADGINNVFTAPWVLVFPGATMVLISLGFNLVGDGLRDVLDPRLRR